MVGKNPKKIPQMVVEKMVIDHGRVRKKTHETKDNSRVIPGTPNNGTRLWEAYHKRVPLLGVPENPIE